MSAALLVYAVSIALFCLPCLLLAWPLPRRSHFCLRLVCCLASMLVYLNSPLVGIFGSSTAAVFAGSSLYFAGILVVLILITMICFEVNIRTAAFCAVCGYTAENLSADLGELAGLIMRINHIPAGNELIRLVIFGALTYAVLYLTLLRPHRNDGPDIDPSRSSLLMVLGVVFLNIVFDLTVKYLRTYNIPQGFSIILRVAVIVMCFYALVLEYEMLYNRRLLAERMVMRRLMHDQMQQYEMSRQNIDAINIKCHDIRHQIRHLEEIGGTRTVDKDTLADIAHQVSIYDSTMKTGNKALDTILTEKALIGEKDHIRLDCIIDGGVLSFMKPADIYSLFGNAIDNAFDAVRELPEDEREISLQVRKAAGMVTAHMENGFAGEVEFRNGLPITTKGDTSNHGFGTRSMHSIVERYGGTLTMGVQGQTFYWNALIPIPSAAESDHS
jgi:hypothetical protein